MSTLELHPEELLDRAARDALTPAEQALLDAHLSRCATCRFERLAMADFAAQPVPELDVERLVTNALTARSTRSLRPRSRRGAALLAAAVALGAMGSFAAASQFSGVLPRLITAIRGTDSAAAVPPTTITAAAHPAEVLAPPEPPPSAPPLVEAQQAPPEPAAAAWAPPPVSARATWTASASRAAAPLAELRREPPPASPELPVLVASPADVFASATRARLEGDRPLAVARYRQLLAGWPASLEAAQTRASLGRLLLDDGAPSAALELLDGYLRGPDGTLREEVLASRALALGRLGRSADEARAWQALLEEYPESIHAVRARARLGSLVAASP